MQQLTKLIEETLPGLDAILSDLQTAHAPPHLLCTAIKCHMTGVQSLIEGILLGHTMSRVDSLFDAYAIRNAPADN